MTLRESQASLALFFSAIDRSMSFGQNVKAQNALKELEKRNACKDLTYDIWIANALIRAYVNEGLLDKAMKLKAQSKKKGAKPNAK
ncbi:hypothetical protein AgCh_000407 [Apium graveolens]